MNPISRYGSTATTALCLMMAVELHAQQPAKSFVVAERSLNLEIPDLDPSGLVRNVVVSGLEKGLTYELIVRLVVESTGFGAYNGDYYAYLLHETPDGAQSQMTVLLNRVGRSEAMPSGYGESGFNITLSDSASWDVHNYQVALGGVFDGPLTGTWQPDGRRVHPTVSLDTSPRTTSLEPLGNLDPNGSWTLFIADMEAGGTGRLVEWEVRGTPWSAIPEPRTVGLAFAGFLALGWGWRRRGGPIR